MDKDKQFDMIWSVVLPETFHNDPSKIGFLNGLSYWNGFY